MKKILCSITLLIAVVVTGYGQIDPIGMWKNIDNEDGKVKSHLEVYWEDGVLKAKVAKLLDNATVTLCKKCKDDKKNQPLVGMEIMWGLTADGDKEWSGGQIMDPKSGKQYKCKIELEKKNKLKVRGFIGIPAFGRTQYWYRLVE